MTNPFDSLKGPDAKQDWEEWGGQFDCLTPRCLGWSQVAEYFPKRKLLTWECDYGHISTMKDVEDD
jgi:hypothetical protein